MTVSYYSRIATSGYSKVFRLLFTWKGSIYKSIGVELIFYILMYGFVSIIYHFILEGNAKVQFRVFCGYCSQGLTSIPVELVLGFYVNLVVTRWSDQFMSIPWPDSLALYITTFVSGLADVPRQIRRTMMRYVNVSQIICFSCISSKAKRIFPDLRSLVDKDLLTEDELVNMNTTKLMWNKYFLPICWAQNLLNKAQSEGYLKDNKRVMHLIGEFNDYRGRLGTLLSYDWINPPLIYTQIAVFIIYGYFILAIFGKQFTEPIVTKTDTFLAVCPLLDILEFIYRMGWLKVAQCLINPFGEDEDDFEMDEIISRNLEYSMLVVDNWHQTVPPMMKDPFWQARHSRLPDSRNSYLTGSLNRRDQIIM